MNRQRAISAIICSVFLLLSILFTVSTAEAKRYHGHSRYHRYNNPPRQSLVDYQTGKIIKGGVVGAGIGAGAGLLLDRPVGRTALVGAGVGAGTQAVRYSRTMRRHPIAKTAAYGALAGTGVQAARGRELLPGALWGGGIGAGLGTLKHF